MSMFDAAPIAAVATAPGRGGIGVIRISGSNLLAFTERFFGQQLTARYAHYLPFNDANGEPIDLGLALFFQAPHSYTGEDVLELQGHGGSAVLSRLLLRVLEIGKLEGLRLAQPGEFSLRAFLNNKIDLTQAEAIADLVDATSTAAAKAAAGSLTGQFSIRVHQLSDLIVQLRVLVEATLDFPEEEIEFIEQYQVKEKLQKIEIGLKNLIKNSNSSLALRDGLRVVLVGQPNVGKSSLLNALCGQSVAIVTDIAGTTRDRIAQDLNLDGVPITLVDTAGLRQTEDIIEKLGIERTWEEISDADVLLHVVDALNHDVHNIANSSLNLFEGSPTVESTKLAKQNYDDKKQLKLILFNKSDLLAQPPLSDDKYLFVSAKSGLGLDVLKSKLLGAAGRSVGESSPWQARARHIDALKKAEIHITHATKSLTFKNIALDLVAEELRLAHESLGEITGKMYADDLLGKIFSNFCIGK